MKFLTNKLSFLSYRLASYKKLSLFINLVLFSAFFALTASALSIYFENKIDYLETQVTLMDAKKIILENHLLFSPITIRTIDNKLNNSFKQSANKLMLKNLKTEDDLGVLRERDLDFKLYYESIMLANLNNSEIEHMIKNFESIFSDNKKKLKELNIFNEKNIKHADSIWKVLAVKAEQLDKEMESLEDIFFNTGVIGIDYTLVKEGIKITKITEGYPADKEGLLVGDTIIKINDYQLKNLKNTADVIKNFKLLNGNISTLIVKRNDGKLLTVKIMPEMRDFYDEEVIRNVKDEFYYMKFKPLALDVKKILMQQKDILISLGIKLPALEIKNINNNSLNLRSKIEKLSRHETNSILIAFIIQFFVFLCIQYFEFVMSPKNEKN